MVERNFTTHHPLKTYHIISRLILALAHFWGLSLGN